MAKKISAMTLIDNTEVNETDWIQMVQGTGTDANKKITRSEFTKEQSTDIIKESTTDAGVTIDGSLIKDGDIKVDTVTEKTADAGVTIDGIKLKDSVVYSDTIVEKTTDAGVNVEGVNFKDNKMGGTYYISTQAEFDVLIENVTGDQYQLIDAVISIVFSNLSGGYQMPGSGAGYLETNNCVSIEMKGGAFFDFNAGIGYLSVNTDDCYLRNVNIQGNGSAGAIVQSFILGANRVTYDNCKCSNRNSTVDMVGFQGSGTELNNITSKYINCSVYTLDGSDKIYGFKDCINLQNSLVYDLDGTVDTIYGLSNCNNISGAYIYDLDNVGDIYGIYFCENISSVTIKDFDSSAGNIYGIDECTVGSSIFISDLTSTGGEVNGIANSISISGIRITNISASGIANGLNAVFDASSINIYIVTSTGSDAYGVIDSKYLAAITVSNITASGTANGFNTCDYGASLFTIESLNAGCDYIDTEDSSIIHKNSCVGTLWQ